MSGGWKKCLAGYLASGVFVGLMAWWYISLRDFSGAKAEDQYRWISDAFAIPGILLLMFGCLIRIRSLGALDGLAYGLRFAVRSLIPGTRYQMETYGDYVERKGQRRIRGYGVFFVSGGVTVAVAVAFMLLFYRSS